MAHLPTLFSPDDNSADDWKNKLAEMSEYDKRYFARNVPMNFIACCENIRAELRPRKNKPLAPYEFNRIYNGMLNILMNDFRTPELDGIIGEEIFEVQIRFYAIQNTMDYNVPTAIIKKRLSMLHRPIHNALKLIKNEDRDRHVRAYTELRPESSFPNTMAAFDQAESIAEKATIAGEIVEKFSDDLEKLTKFFDYKHGLASKGQPSKYALLYAVLALADIFETHNVKRLKANVQQTVNTNADVPNAYLYSGDFLGFVESFLFSTDMSEMQRFSSGLQDTIRKHSKRRKNDPIFYKLIHKKTVTPMDLLDFMKRADAIK